MRESHNKYTKDKETELTLLGNDIQTKNKALEKIKIE